MTLEPGTVLDASALGFTVEVIATAATTDGAYFEFDAVGTGRGVVAQPHVHERQTESFEVIEGALRLDTKGVSYHLGPGDKMTVSAGTRHRQRNPAGPSRVRIRHEPAGESEAFFTRLAELSSTGGYDRLGMPRPRAGARLIRDFPDHRSALLPPRAQQALSRLLLRGRS
jgi:mannose-6-phosphate isomerase-like protein (cupin superfamily)